MPVSTAADDRLWTIEDLSAYLGVPVATLYRWRRYRCAHLPCGRTAIPTRGPLCPTPRRRRVLRAYARRVADGDVEP